MSLHFEKNLSKSLCVGIWDWLIVEAYSFGYWTVVVLLLFLSGTFWAFFDELLFLETPKDSWLYVYIPEVDSLDNLDYSEDLVEIYEDLRSSDFADIYFALDASIAV